MVAKIRSQHVCQSCGHVAMAWTGRCPDCGEWNTLVESAVPQKAAAGKARAASTAPSGKPVLLRDVVALETARYATGIGELDRVLGGGIVPGSLILLGGSPGIGKSTLTGMAMANLQASESKRSTCPAKNRPHRCECGPNGSVRPRFEVQGAGRELAGDDPRARSSRSSRRSS